MYGESRCNEQVIVRPLRRTRRAGVCMAMHKQRMFKRGLGAGREANDVNSQDYVGAVGTDRSSKLMAKGFCVAGDA